MNGVEKVLRETEKGEVEMLDNLRSEDIRV